MQEIRGNLWEQRADVLVITTNGTIKADGRAVMGRGCAYEASQKFPHLPLELGKTLSATGNHVYIFDVGLDHKLITFPVKHQWFQVADLQLIQRSALELVTIANTHPEWQRIVLVRPGAGNGKLDWEDVKAAIAPILDDRFCTITQGDTNGS